MTALAMPKPPVSPCVLSVPPRHRKLSRMVSSSMPHPGLRFALFAFWLYTPSHSSRTRLAQASIERGSMMRTKKLFIAFVLGLGLTVALLWLLSADLLPIARAVGIDVDTTNDGVANNNNCTLREAIISLPLIPISL